MTKEERLSCIEAQARQFARCAIPCFSPADGICPDCGEDIYSEGGIDYRTAHTRPVLFCPKCRSRFRWEPRRMTA